MPLPRPARAHPARGEWPAGEGHRPVGSASRSECPPCHTGGMTQPTDVDPACGVAHGAVPAETGVRTLVAVFASPVADQLLRFGADCGFRPLLVEPDAQRASAAGAAGATVVSP